MYQIKNTLEVAMKALSWVNRFPTSHGFHVSEWAYLAHCLLLQKISILLHKGVSIDYK